LCGPCVCRFLKKWALCRPRHTGFGALDSYTENPKSRRCSAQPRWRDGRTVALQHENDDEQPDLLQACRAGLVREDFAHNSIDNHAGVGRVTRKGTPWLFLDAGVYNALYEALAFQGSTRYQVRCLRPSEAWPIVFSLAGPTGDSPDVIARDALLPADIRVGDKVVFEAVGAYTLSVSSRFNGFPTPPVHFLECASQARRIAR
jgi:hypothetical protein